jgi:hypothetical protein
LAHICRCSESEIDYALCHRLFGAEDALVIPRGGHDASSDEIMYGILSEEGRQTVSMAILSALLESDDDLAWYFSDGNKSHNGMDLSRLMKDVRTHWHDLEEDGVICSRRETVHDDTPMLTDSKHETQSESQSQFFTPAEFHKLKSGPKENAMLSDEVIWHCLRSMVHYIGSGDHKNAMPCTVWLVPDEVAKLAAHNVFLRSSSSDGWKECDFMESWNMRMPSISKYEPSLDLLRGIALSNEKSGEDGESKRMLQYFPEAGLALVPSLRIKSMFAMRSEWSLQDALPYLCKFVCRGSDSKAVIANVETEVKELLEKYAKVTTNSEENGGKDAIKYVLLTK